MKAPVVRSALGIMLLALAVSCGKPSRVTVQEKGDVLTVGFAQMDHLNPWRVEETNNMKAAAEKRGVTLLITDANTSQKQQILDIENLLARGADYIVCAPLVYTGWREIFEACRKAGVPLIMLDREAEGKVGYDFLTFVGSNFVKEGETAARWLATKTGSSARIVELKGNDGASCTRDREIGFRNVVSKIPGMQIVASGCGDFERIKGQKAMEEIILSHGRDFDAVYAHNDEMAIGAIQALKAANMRPGKDVIVVSIDGSKDALKAIIAGQLGATVECTPRLAEKVFAAIETRERGGEVPPRIESEDRLFDGTNAARYFDEAF